jgi:VWFA-related protein
VKSTFMAIALSALVSSGLSMSSVVLAQEQQSNMPDAPAPQASRPLSELNGPITPGKGTGGVASEAKPQAASGSQATSSAQGNDAVQNTPPELPAAGEGVEQTTTLIRMHVNFVEVPVTVKDADRKLVAGLTYRDFKVFENNIREPIAFFTTDAFPLSIAFVIDQSLPSDVMAKVNSSLGAIQGALTPYDEAAVFSYSNGAQERTGFTGAQSNRLPAVLALARETGRDMQVPVNDGPMAGCSIRQNGNCVDPNLQPGKSAGGSTFMTIPKEIHTLNDAVLAAAKELSTRPKGRRRIIYVISDGKEYGSKASYKEVLRYLQTNKIAVYGTLVGDSARWGEGYISHIHLPFTMYDNILYKYIAATGGTPDAERGLNGIEKSYAKIAEEARNQYTLGYYSNQPVIDGKFRKIEVSLDRPNMEVIAKTGYYPSAEDSR